MHNDFKDYKDMQRKIHTISFALVVGVCLSLSAQTPLPQSTSQGSSITTTYATSGPGLPVSTLFEGRLAQPAGVPIGGIPVAAQAGTLPYSPPGAGPYTPAPRDSERPLPISRGRLEPIPVQSGMGDISFHPETPSYTFPGLVTQFAGKWIGSDYLYNLPPDIGIAIDVVTPDNFPLRIDQLRIKDAAADVFSRGNITPISQAVGDMPPLPFLHFLIFVQSAEESVVAFVEARYFEGVKLFRLDYSLPGTVQAITWEKQDLIVDAPNRIEEQILVSAEGLAREFVSRVHYFERQRYEEEEMLRLRCGGFSGLPSGAQQRPPKPRRPFTPSASSARGASPTPRAGPSLSSR